MMSVRFEETDSLDGQWNEKGDLFFGSVSLESILRITIELVKETSEIWSCH
jgi:hypothetical protein